VSDVNGVNTIYLWDSQTPDGTPHLVGTGDWPTWDPTGTSLFTTVVAPNENGATAYSASSGQPALPYMPLPGAVYGLDWKLANLPDLLYQQIQNTPPAVIPTLWFPVLTLSPAPNSRQGLVKISNVKVPYPYLQDTVDEAFQSLREETGVETGWDFLDTLENAYLPLTSPPQPGMAQNWLYTGRAIAVNTMPIHADWMIVVREMYDGQNYWRVFLRARYQDGSQGMPLTSLPWNLEARYQGNAFAYEQGGVYAPMPSGYWVDFTELASRFGWKRLPTLPDWRTYYPAARYNIFVNISSVDWYQAMSELYPPEALWTATPIPTFTQTPSPTPIGTRTTVPTATDIPTITVTTTPTDTATVAPSQ
jgi:hypothetical protein